MPSVPMSMPGLSPMTETPLRTHLSISDVIIVLRNGGATADDIGEEPGTTFHEVRRTLCRMNQDEYLHVVHIS